MAAIVNFIDATLQAATVRTVNLPTAQILVTPNAPAFHVAAGGANSPASISFTRTLIDLEGTVSFTCTGGTLTNITASSADLTYANMSAGIATVTASLTVNGIVYSGSSTISKVLDGSIGANAAYVSVDGQQVFSRATSAAAFAPASITLTATPYGGTATYQWQYWTGSAWANVASGGTSAIYAIASGDFTDQRLYRVQATIGATVYTDQFTMVQVTGGTNGVSPITGFLTNESVTLAADSAGTVASFATASGIFKVYDGITDKTGTTGPVAYSVVSQTGCVVAITSAGAYSVSAMSADNASATLQAVYGGVTIPIVLTLAKSRAGSSTAGSRGAGHFYASGSAWSDATADAACPGGKVVGDVVTISSGTFVMEKQWNGSAWNASGVVIDGSLLVTGSVTAAKINVNGLTVNKPDGTPIITTTGLQPGFEAPNTKNSDIVIGGRNLYSRTTPFYDAAATGSALASRSTTGFDLVGTVANTGLMRMTNVIPKNGTYTISFDLAIGAGNYPLSIDMCDGAIQTITLSQTVARYSLTFTVTNWSAATYHFIDFNNLSAQPYSFRNFMVEEGNKASSWRPSPEDVAADTAAAGTTATWNGVGSRPANLVSLNGSEGIKNTDAQFSPIKTLEFRNTLDGLSYGGCTVALAADSVIVTANTVDPVLYVNGLSFSGKVYDKIRIRVKRNGGSGWDGGLYWGILGGHGIDGGYRAAFVDPMTLNGPYVIIEIDMSAVVDWTSNTITQLRIDLGSSASDIFEIDWITIGKYAPVQIKDLGFVGDLNATIGAPPGTFVGGTDAGLVASRALNGDSAFNAINDSATGLSSRLRSNAANVLTNGAGLTAGTLTYNASTGARTGGYGVALTQFGLVGYNSSGALTISISAATGAIAVAGDLSGSTGTFGAVTVGVSLNSGLSAYNTGASGYWLDYLGRFSLKTSSGASILCDGSTITIKDAVTVKTTPFAVNNIADATRSWTHGTGEQYIGSFTASSTGGTGTANFSWSLDGGSASAQGATFRFDRSPTGATMGVYVKCNVVANVDAYVTVSATANGESAIPETFNINVDFS